MTPDEALRQDAVGADDEHGLHFICLNGNIARQFEFVNNTWLNSPKFAGLYDDSDPVTAPSQPHGGTFTVQSDTRARARDRRAPFRVRQGRRLLLPPGHRRDAQPRGSRRVAMALDADDRLQLDYDQTQQLLRTLTDIRFKLLAFVPTIAGASVGFFGRARPAAELMAIGLVGLVATLGILIYELRNSQTYAEAVQRARMLEQRLELGSGGLLSEPRAGTGQLFGFLPIGRELGLALVYGAALAGWTYLVAWGGLEALDVPGARGIGVVIGAAVGFLVVVEVSRVGGEEGTPG